STVSMNGHLPAFFEWALPILSIILNVTAVIGLSLHVFVYKPMKKAEDNLNGDKYYFQNDFRSCNKLDDFINVGSI
ncbi:hypothetical protein, partial [Priestia megaterium]|uniref:hypothetical protein n=1 Tax=Priestia megaterium TaxID=1404 RepID=UPI0030012506